MADRKPDYMTVDEFKNRMYQTYASRGIINGAKSHVRNGLVAELQRSTQGQLTVQDLEGPQEGSLLRRAANCLVADHLRQCQYDYTLSVFLPECDLAQDKLFGAEDLLQLLNISKDSKLFHRLMKHLEKKHGKSFLWQVLQEVAALHANTTFEFGVQTDLIHCGPITSLDEKLHTLEELYSSRREESQRRGAVAVEERLLSYQRQLEDRYNSELKRELARMKDNEMARIRLEEREKGRKELDKMRRELERDYQSKYDALVERERNSVERLRKEQEMQEKEIYAQRQSLLQEIESVRQREAEIKREGEVNGREKRVHEDRIKGKEQELQKREFEVKRKEREIDQRVQNEIAQFKLEYQGRFIERSQNIEVREAKVKEGERQVAEEKAKIQTLKDELRDKTHRANELETFLQESKHSEVNATKHNEFLNAKLREMSDYKTLKEQNAVLRNELETVRTRLSEVLNMNERERGRQEELLRELRRPNPETLLMQRDLEKARENLRQEQMLFEQQKQLLEGRLSAEVDRNKELLRRFEEQTLQMREMNREIVDLRQHLNLTQKALSNEVYRKPHDQEDGSPRRSPVSFLSPGRPLDEVPSSQHPRHQPRFDDNDIYNDVDVDLDLPAAARPHYPGLSEEDVSSVGSADLVAEAKYRLRSLEKEAHNLDRAYHDFHCHMTNAAAVPSITRPPPVRSPHLSPQRSRSGRPMESPRQSPIPRPMSSTPYRKRAQADYHNDSFEELSGGAKSGAREKPLPHFNLSAMSEDDLDGRQKKSAGDERRVRSRAITMDDLEARPGSPSIMVVAGSESSGKHSPDPRQTPQESGFSPVVPSATAPSSLPPIAAPSSLPPAAAPSLAPLAAAPSLDAAWKTQPALSLEDAWKVEKQREEERAGQEEAAGRQREQELREAREREERELQRLEEARRKEAAAAEEEEAKAPEDNIDPMMQQYMAMVQQQKEKEKQITKKVVDFWSKGHSASERSVSPSEQEISVAEDIKSVHGSDDDSEW